MIRQVGVVFRVVTWIITVIIGAVRALCENAPCGQAVKRCRWLPEEVRWHFAASASNMWAHRWVHPEASGCYERKPLFTFPLPGLQTAQFRATVYS